MKDFFLFIFGGIIFSCITYISIFYIKGDRSTEDNSVKSEADVSKQVSFGENIINPVTLTIEKEFDLTVTRPHDTEARQMALILASLDLGDWLLQHPLCYRSSTSTDLERLRKKVKLEFRFLPYIEKG